MSLQTVHCVYIVWGIECIGYSIELVAKYHHEYETCAHWSCSPLQVNSIYLSMFTHALFVGINSDIVVWSRCSGTQESSLAPACVWWWQQHLCSHVCRLLWHSCISGEQACSNKFTLVMTASVCLGTLPLLCWSTDMSFICWVLCLKVHTVFAMSWFFWLKSQIFHCASYSNGSVHNTIV